MQNSDPDPKMDQKRPKIRFDEVCKKLFSISFIALIEAAALAGGPF